MVPSRIGSIYRLDKRHLTIIPLAKSAVEGCVAIVDRNINFMRLRGPTSEEVLGDVDLTNKTCLITGANSGIGLEMTRCLNSHNCSVLMACRNTYEASSVVKNKCDNQHLLKFFKINLASLNSVKNTVDEIISLDKKIDIVILNAGVFGLPWILTEDRLETTFQVNFLSQYYLLTSIEKVLSSDVRVVLMSSESHRNINWSLNEALTPTIDNVSLPEQQYTSIKAYNISKLCGLLSMHYLGYRWLHSDKQVFCAHPGSFVKTKLCRNWWVYETLYTLMVPFAKSISQAASTPLYCATSTEVKNLSALYYKNCQPCEESELAKDFHLAFRIHDLAYDVLRDRGLVDEPSKLAENTHAYAESSKDSLDDNLASNYSD